MNKLLLDNPIKKGIIASLTASILFVVFIEPIFKLFFELLVDIADNVIIGLVDNFYKSASLGHRNDLDFFQLFFMVCFLFIVLFILILKIKEIISENNELTEKDIEKSDIDSLKMKIEELNVKISSSKSKESKYVKIFQFLNIPSIVFSCFFAIILIYFLTTSYVDLQLNTSFNQRLTALRPYISEIENYKIKAQWSQMKSRKDFLSINLQIDSIASINKIELPQLLLE